MGLLVNDTLGWQPDSVSLTWGVRRGVRFPTALPSHPLVMSSITSISFKILLVLHKQTAAENIITSNFQKCQTEAHCSTL